MVTSVWLTNCKCGTDCWAEFAAKQKPRRPPAPSNVRRRSKWGVSRLSRAFARARPATGKAVPNALLPTGGRRSFLYGLRASRGAPTALLRCPIFSRCSLSRRSSSRSSRDMCAFLSATRSIRPSVKPRIRSNSSGVGKVSGSPASASSPSRAWLQERSPFSARILPRYHNVGRSAIVVTGAGHSAFFAAL